MYKIVGINSEVETCEHCGKTGLKKVVWLDELDQEGNLTGNVRAFGVNCAAYALLGNKNRTPSQNEKYILEQAYQDKSELRATYFETKCFLTPDNIYIEKGYKIGQVMKEQQIDRLSAVAYIKEQMRLNNWFLR